ncbi:hypothetical protein SAY86_028967 [Trapa natans]|uniref:Uncharacterized protein n=1 Tax=Trapa natans TaxID=22666 RepID=A0AAN7MK09_TRANT|nr:hypothetical protein SAY86_028967 [Trapa natans]
MAPPVTDLAQVEREGFAIIDEFWPVRKQKPPPPPLHREANQSLLYHPSSHPQIYTCVYHFTESPLVTLKLPYAQTLSNESVIIHPQNQYIYRSYQTNGGF